MFAYKYFSAKWGFAFLESLRIRYSQFSALNDPYEGEVFVRDLLSKDQWELVDAGELDPNRFNPGMKEIVEDIQSGKLDRYEALQICTNWLKKDRDRYGVLSMSANPTSLPMWAHYCDNHTGMVLGFDADHSTFHHGGPSIRPVVYVSKCPEVIFSRMTGLDMWYTKNAQWSYEEELRHTKILDPGSVAGNSKSGEPSVHLFDIPKECVRKIILGENVSEESIKRARGLKEQFPRVVIERAIRVLNGYAMESVALDPNES